jgi:hypothetical protein
VAKPKCDGLSRRGFLGCSLGAVTLASIGHGSDDGAESSTDLGSGGSGGTTDGKGSGGAATGDTSAASGGGASPTATASSEHLAAACGTYCGACPSYIAKHSEDETVQRPNPWGDCDGCLSGGMLAAHCQTCRIRLCAANRQNVTRCSDCDELPCYRVTGLINLGSYPHRQEYLPNLALIGEMGAQEWVRYEEERWRCPRCGLPMSWYDTACARCGESRSADLFPVTEDTRRPY